MTGAYAGVVACCVGARMEIAAIHGAATRRAIFFQAVSRMRAFAKINKATRAIPRTVGPLAKSIVRVASKSEAAWVLGKDRQLRGEGSFIGRAGLAARDIS